METIRAQGIKLIDSRGRTRIFSGVNVVDKSDFSPRSQRFDCIDENGIKQLAERGFNLIRLGFTWGKIEYAPGLYSEEYLDSISEIIDLCAKYGIFVFLDMHQDLYSSYINGDGAPKWATLTDGRKVTPTRFVWAEDYFWGRACHRAFDNFWNNRTLNGKGLQDWFADCWVYIITRLGSKPNVIGFDLLNEPFPGTPGGKVFRRIVTGAAKEFLFGKNVDRLQLIRDLVSPEREEKLLNTITPQVLRAATSRSDKIIEEFDKTRYTPFIGKLASAVRKAGSEKLIFLENSYFSNLGIPYSASPASINGKRDSQQVFAPHAYDFMVDTPSYRYANNARVGSIFEEHKRSQDRLQMPVIVGEWGGFGADDDDSWLGHIAYLLSVFDNNQWSNTYWQYNPGFFNSPLMKVFVRPYPQAVNGEIKNYSYNIESSVFTLNFTQDSEGESVVSAPFPIKTLSVDGKEYPYTIKGAAAAVNTLPGDHEVIICFDRKD